MESFKAMRRSLLFIFGVVAILSILTFVFYRKISAMLTAETEHNLLNITEQYAISYEKSLQNTLEYLTGIARLASYRQQNEDWQDVEAALKDSTFKFSSYGIVDLQGTGILGRNLPLARHPGLQQVFRGHSSITAIKPGKRREKSRFLFAVPILHGPNIRYALYGVLDERRLEDMLASVIGNVDAQCYITDAEYRVVLPVNDPVWRARIDDWMDNPSRHRLEESIRSLHNKVKRYKRGIERFDMAGSGHFYVEIVPLQMNDWLFTCVVSGEEMQKRVNLAVKLFLLVFGALLLLFVIVLAYTQIADAAYKAKMHELAYEDRLTGLPNWEKMKKEIPRLMALEKDVKNWFLVTFDLKNFKMINELFGYKRGDEILSRVASCLRETDRNMPLTCRIENDTFGAFVPASSEAEVEKKIRNRLACITGEELFQNQRLRLYSGACAVFPGRDQDLNSILNSSRIAREHAKEHGRTEMAFYDDAIKAHMVLAEQLKADLDDALASDEIIVYLQPKYAIAIEGHEKLVGAEALVRWQHRTRGFLSPGLFIPVFEEDGSIKKIDRHMFTRVCQCIGRWIRERKPIYPVSVNLSRIQLSNPNLTRELAAIADEYRAPRKFIDIELTETSSFGDMDQLLKTMHELREYGFRLSLDDFGTGYSSLSLLREMPMDILKLDKSFIDPWASVEENPKGLQFIKDIITMADNLGIQTLAEGVETLRQVQLLREVHCDIVQGYYFNKPMPVPDYEGLLAGPGTRSVFKRSVT